MGSIFTYALAVKLVTSSWYTQLPIVEVRSAPSDSAAVISLLPLGTPLNVDRSKVVGNGFAAVELRNEDTFVDRPTKGFVKLSQLGESRNAAAVRANDTRLNAKAPIIIGVCYENRVALLAEFKGNRFQSLVENVTNSTENSPEMKASIRRLKARAVEFSTLRFYRYGRGETRSGNLIEAGVATKAFDSETFYNYIDMGPCPWISDEGPIAQGVVFVSAPLAKVSSSPIQATELAVMISFLNREVQNVHVYQPNGKVVELQANDGSYFFRRGTAKPFVSLPDPKIPVWVRLENGMSLRVSCSNEDVNVFGWGIPDAEKLYLDPQFQLTMFSASGEILGNEVVLLRKHES